MTSREGSLLLEAGSLAIFLGNDDVAPPVLVRWLLLRLEFGAGLIKLRATGAWWSRTLLGEYVPPVTEREHVFAD